MELRVIDPRIVDVIRRVTKNPDITAKDIRNPFLVLGWDSLMSVEIIIEIQNIFGIEMEPSEVLGIRNLGDLQELIHNKKKNGIGSS
jgi:acyl carrier protein